MRRVEKKYFRSIYVKKLIVFLVLCTFFGMNVSAEFIWSMGGRAIFTPISYSGGDTAVSSATYSSEVLPRIEVGFKASPENGNLGIVANLDLNQDGGITAAGGNAKVWIQPFPFIKLTLGKFDEVNLRSKIGNTEFASWLLPNGGRGEDNIFTLFQANLGAHLSVTPIEGLYVETALGSNAGDERANRNLIGNDALDVYKAIQAGIGYRIPDIGFARLQFIGNSRTQLRYNETRNLVAKRLVEGLTKGRDADVIEAAFLFDMIEGLTIDAGMKIPLKYTTDTKSEIYPALYPDPPYEAIEKQETTVQFPYIIAMGTTYNWNDLNIRARVDLSVGGQAVRKNIDTITYGFTIGAWVTASYYITDSIRAGLDTGMEFHAPDRVKSLLQRSDQEIAGSDRLDFGVGPWGEMLVAGGSLKIGLMVMIPSSERYTYDPSKAQNYNFTKIFTGMPVISVPISLTYEF
jgi:hypothetical protein